MRKYDSTVARIAGNIMPALIQDNRDSDGTRMATSEVLAKRAVRLARLIVAEVERTEPPAPDPRVEP